MTNTKPWWQSRTVWAAAVSLLAGLFHLAGLDLDASLQDELVTLLTACAQIAAGITAFIGRLKADARIGWRRA
jgi:hypothetical protein